MFKCYSISFFLVILVLLLFTLLFSVGGLITYGSNLVVICDYLKFDSISFYLVLLVLLLGVCSNYFFVNVISRDVQFFLFLSLLFSILSFCINHSILFWVFYELSMLPLLYLIFSSSPYSERFLAGWYFSCYLLITSLPLILILIYLSIVNESWFFYDWHSGCSLSVLLVLSFVFFTKVPLVPFHTWLPIVHAEATSIVSIFLSGYIMKLGLLGVYRCTYYIFGPSLVNYLALCFLMSVCFLILSCNELDGKRWLAFLSLGHIVVPFIGLFISDIWVINNMFLYCLGHGLSAGIVFGLLWYFYDSSNSRNWLLLKSSINSKDIMLLVVVSLLTLCSFPTTIQFFCEVGFIKYSAENYLYIFFWGVYLFFGGLVPLVLCGHLLIRSEWTEMFSYDKFSMFNFIIVLCIWCFTGLLVV
uniref:NADH-ubiquinone oxidoreductase chain 4 n=1 Tax=Hymenolepis microstoma TaxID=85433 RepID=A0A1E1GI16_HYMMI|nr:NADH dehydrogenase subunit 4 [Hymenolepis microstoma]BBB87188.1 NADH dehydrogenase subunit 4 [Hymenolepis microstoma]